MKFNLGDHVMISESGKKGNIVGREEFQHSEASYLIRYKSADGRAAESWWNESALEPA